MFGFGCGYSGFEGLGIRLPVLPAYLAHLFAGVGILRQLLERDVGVT